MASEQAEWKKFRRWLRNHLADIEESGFDYDTAAMEKFGVNLDVCTGDYEKDDKINNEMAIFKWTNEIYMSEEDVKKTPADKRAKLPVAPQMFDLASAERIVLNKSDLKVTEIQAEQENLS
jgi:hypothetical protein